MKLTFTEEQIANELHKIYLEEDDLLMEGEFVTGEGKNYIITGVATIEGERYHEFEIEFELTEEPAEETLEAIMQTDWEWYDFLCGLYFPKKRERMWSEWETFIILCRQIAISAEAA